jgi:hypothetical protein
VRPRAGISLCKFKKANAPSVTDTHPWRLVGLLTRIESLIVTSGEGLPATPPLGAMQQFMTLPAAYDAAGGIARRMLDQNSAPGFPQLHALR